MPLAIHLLGAVVAAHWDELETMQPGLQKKFESDSCAGTLVGIDTDAALAGDGRNWRVAGKNQVHVLRAGPWATYHDGDEFELSIFPLKMPRKSLGPGPRAEAFEMRADLCSWGWRQTYRCAGGFLVDNRRPGRVRAKLRDRGSASPNAPI